MVRMTEEQFAQLQSSLGVRAKTKAEKAARDPASPKRKRNAWVRADGFPTENGEARTLADWMRREEIFFVRVPNEGNLGQGRGGFLNVLKLTGLVADAPDFLVLEHPRVIPVELQPREYGHFCGVAVELKAQPKRHPSGRLEWPEVREGQKAFLRRMEEKGWIAFVAFGAQEAIRRLGDLGLGKSARNRRER
jgi:hypothetical protein